MRWRRRLTGERAVITLAALIGAYEVAAPSDQMISHAFDRWMLTHPTVTIASVTITALHLVNALPPMIDPYHHVNRLIGRTRG